MRALLFEADPGNLWKTFLGAPLDIPGDAGGFFSPWPGEIGGNDLHRRTLIRGWTTCLVLCQKLFFFFFLITDSLDCPSRPPAPWEIAKKKKEKRRLATNEHSKAGTKAQRRTSQLFSRLNVSPRLISKYSCVCITAILVLLLFI